jgi:hypothetical protein
LVTTLSTTTRAEAVVEEIHVDFTSKQTVERESGSDWYHYFK